MRQAPICAHPNAAVTTLQNGSDEIVDQAMPAGEFLYALAFHVQKPRAVGADPEIALPVAQQSAHAKTRQPRKNAGPCNPVSDTKQMCGCGHPNRSVGVVVKRFELRICAAGKGYDAHRSPA